ncbi:hypothetical protein COCMIDRAFT_29341 [Bipolaris oryzae ATCC 44560]|uniref:Uncharacterized protein n=1 Tax=Bipolaris oryzae ATCC 44560 TaxID=930090 RepID=W6Z2U9_COCMI|nr:uncharacterized protein COCMIDRAFT_29341 [Bipolaris oryzae ATCC 44560]EUC41984.1 hypothetical protein COCMIDRAFT_29341 [Bipolaris oryzae ATCC 44560]
MPRQLRREDYTVGWVCALPIELAAAQEMLDEEHLDLKHDASDNDENLYALGSIGGHNVVIVCLPAGQIGNNPAAAVAMQMRATFKKIQFGLMVGIGGGVPSAADIRLGDVVASQPHGIFAGVVQYDIGKNTPSGFERTGSLNAPPKLLLAALVRVRANEVRGRSKLSEHVAKLEGSIAEFQRSEAGPDVLFEAAYDHEADDRGKGQTCDGWDLSRQITRRTRDARKKVAVHYGTIASGNQVMRSAIERDRVSTELGGVLCFEMEATGLMNSFPCLAIRGICDYADSHKNKWWQPYAAATAAAYAKEVLLTIPQAEVSELRTAEDATQSKKRNSERSRSPDAKRRKVDGTEDLETGTTDQQKFTASVSLSSEQREKEKRYGRDAWEWAENELKEALSNILSEATHHRHVVVFIDALDECGEDPAKSLLAYFRDLIHQAKSKHARFRICLSSRHYPILALDTIPSIQVEKMNDQDIRWYVRERLKDITSETKREQIQAEILSKSNGGFQWVFLVTRGIVDKNLNGIKAEKLLEKIATCPKTLSKMYETILNGVPAADQHQMIKVFQWVLFAERPLSAQELRDALATDKNMSYRTARDLRTHEGWSDTLVDFERYVKHISRGLICFQSRELWEQYELNGPDSDREAQLIDQSVADFLKEEFSGLFGNHLTAAHSFIGSSQLQISRSCLRYMILEDILEDATLPRGVVSSKSPLAPYAVRFLFTHITEVEKEGVHQSDLISVMQWTPNSEIMRRLATLWRALDPDSRYKPFGWPFIQATALHVSVSFGSMSAVDTLLDSGFKEFEGRDADGDTSLMLAITKGYQDIALVLLDRIMDCEGQQRQHNANKDCGVTPLSVACATVINAQNNNGETALDFALEYNMRGVVFKLVEAGASPEHLGRQAALIAHVISHGDMKLLSILIEKKVKLDGAVFFALKEQPPLQDSVLEGMIFQLLSAGANTARSSELDIRPERQDDYDTDDEDISDYDTDALELVSRRGLTDVVEMLLQHGAPVALQNDLGECPLMIATRNRHKEIVRILLSRAPSLVEMEDAYGSTALDEAFSSEPEIMKLLLQEGEFSTPTTSCKTYFSNLHETDWLFILKLFYNVDPDSKDNSGSTPLLHAARNGNSVIVQQLLDTGKVNADAKDNNGWTPLLWAVSNGCEVVVRQLLDTDKVNADADDNNGWTTLLWAAYSGHEAVVKQLLDTGKVDANTKDKHGWMPLLWAAHEGHEAVFTHHYAKSNHQPTKLPHICKDKSGR